MPWQTDVVVIGAGQAGLAMSQGLSARGVEHVVLERGRVGERWLSERWPGLTLLSPNWLSRLPGFGGIGAAPGGFMSGIDFATGLAGHALHNDTPMVTDCAVTDVSAGPRGFVVRSTLGEWSARAVVVATGACDRPLVPGWAAGLPQGIRQVTATDYRGARGLPEGGVLVVGASATGAQLAAEIQASGRPVTLAVGRHVRAPRRYRGRDVFHWLHRSGFLYEPRQPGEDPAHLIALPSLQLIGTEAGHEIDLARLSAAGVRLAGRALGVRDGRVQFAPSLGAEQMAAERRRRRLLATIDAHIEDAGLATRADPAAWAAPSPLGAGPGTLDLTRAGIGTVVWATGFRRSYPWLRLPALDPQTGEIANSGGLTPVPGLYAMGLPFMRHRSSAFIYGVQRDAEALAEVIAARLTHSTKLAA